MEQNNRPLPRSDRSRLAKDTINKTIPALLASYPKANAGVAGAQILRELSQAPASSVVPSQRPAVRVIDSDTLDAAQLLHMAHPSDRIAVLSMASPLRPGGGILTGATSQEESLCMRSTLYPSLREDFYRIPDDALIYTSNVLIFRAQDLSPLPKSDYFFVDVISCPALRFPEVEDGRYAAERDREVMVTKIRLIIRAAAMNECKRIVLGALGCGAYSNPVREVAEMFRRVIYGSPRRKCENMGSIEEVVFAIHGGKGIIEVFREVLQGVTVG